MADEGKTVSFPYITKLRQYQDAADNSFLRFISKGMKIDSKFPNLCVSFHHNFAFLSKSFFARTQNGQGSSESFVGKHRKSWHSNHENERRHRQNINSSVQQIKATYNLREWSGLIGRVCVQCARIAGQKRY